MISGNSTSVAAAPSLALMAAEELRRRLLQVRPVIADTASISFNFVTGGSRITLPPALRW